MRPGRTTRGAAAVLIAGMILPSALAADRAIQSGVSAVEVTIEGRQFHPTLVKIPAGQDVRLIFRNKDAELHAVVPIGFLENVPLHVDGNGAPQFGPQGLVRVLVPSGGRVEVQFAPKNAGVFVYRCDLPGHQMVGRIVVD